MRLRHIAMAAVASVGGLGLVGVGAHAVFTTSTASSQTINAGTLGVVLSSPDAPGCTSPTDGCTSLTLSPVGPVGSTFDTAPSLITITNTGNIPAYYSTVNVSDTNNNSTFRSELGMCDYSYGGNGAGHYVGVDNNGLLTAQEGTFNISGSGAEYVIQPGATDSYAIDFYAGQASSVCGGSAIPSLTQAAQGGSLSMTITYAYTG